MSKHSSIFLLALIIITTVIAGVFISPVSLIGPIGPMGPIGPIDPPWRLGLDLVGGTHLVYEIDMKDVNSEDRDSVAAGLKDVIEKRVNLFGVSEPQVISAKKGEAYRLIVELAGIKDVSAAVKMIGETPFLEFREVIVQPTIDNQQPIIDNQQLTIDNQQEAIQFVPTNLTGRYLRSAKIDFGATIGAPFLSLEFNDEGAKIFEEITARNVGKQLCTFIDEQLADCATVQEKISGGRAQITGKFTADEVKQMASRFNAGALPAPINLVSQQTIGPSLGQESLKKAISAGLIGALAIILFVLIYYRKLGIFASLVLLIYVILMAAIFKLGITMTLAGIAGFILSIGMVVDANILIFERTKEEIRRGLSKAVAIEEGFRRAWPSIRDSNISTIITSIILYYFTTSFVKGFALALLIGVLVSMFSAIIVSRTMLRVFIKK
jgi:protein-export membrane protein SecD